MVSVKVGAKRQGPVSSTKASSTASLPPSSPALLPLLPQHKVRGAGGGQSRRRGATDSSYTYSQVLGSLWRAVLRSEWYVWSGTQTNQDVSR